MIDWGFKPFAYLPAWKNCSPSKFEDVIVFGWTKILPDVSKMQLIPEGITFLAHLQ